MTFYKKLLYTKICGKHCKYQYSKFDERVSFLEGGTI